MSGIQYQVTYEITGGTLPVTSTLYQIHDGTWHYIDENIHNALETGQFYGFTYDYWDEQPQFVFELIDAVGRNEQYYYTDTSITPTPTPTITPTNTPTPTPTPIPTVVYFTTIGDDTFTVPAGVTTLIIECWGAGGHGLTAGSGGAPASVSSGGGGGGGAYVKKTMSVTPSTIYDLWVDYPNSDENGTWFDTSSTVYAESGQNSTWNLPNPNGVGGEGGKWYNSIGDLRYSGGNGEDGCAVSCSPSNYSGGGGGAAGSTGTGNSANEEIGGAARVQSGGRGGNGRRSNSVNGNGEDGQAYGAGGGGGLSVVSPYLGLRGDGHSGLIKITYY